MKIISGGQSGADRGGLEAARILGFETGGTAPKGYRTESGLDLSLADLGLTEDNSPSYRYRTIRNVEDSDATVWFGDTNSPGGRLTLSAVAKAKKPCLSNPSRVYFRGWLKANNVQVLNVAGNRESTNPGIQSRVTVWLLSAFEGWQA